MHVPVCLRVCALPPCLPLGLLPFACQLPVCGAALTGSARPVSLRSVYVTSQP